MKGLQVFGCFFATEPEDMCGKCHWEDGLRMPTQVSDLKYFNF